MGCVYFKNIAVAILIGAKICGANNLVDWSDWHDQPNNPSSPANSSSGTVFEKAVSAKPGYRGSLHDLVDECAQRLVLRRVTCDQHANQRVPFMESGDLACGFETPIGHKTYEDLTSRYVFHFVGDSTTRRLAEGFFSIATGTALPHEYYHDRRNFTIGNLQVNFHWAPFCSEGAREPGIGAGIEEVLDDQQQENRLGGGRQAIVLTAFGVWDAVHGTGDQTALRDCSDVVTKISKVAQTPTNIQERTAGNDGPPPIVFLLQNNPFLPGSKEDIFLNDLHHAQREFVEHREDSGIYRVYDRDSIFKRMSCFRLGETIHFRNPVKLVEGKMLWDLIALVAGAKL